MMSDLGHPARDEKHVSRMPNASDAHTFSRYQPLSIYMRLIHHLAWQYWTIPSQCVLAQLLLDTTKVHMKGCQGRAPIVRELSPHNRKCLNKASPVLDKVYFLNLKCFSLF